MAMQTTLEQQIATLSQAVASLAVQVQSQAARAPVAGPVPPAFVTSSAALPAAAASASALGAHATPTVVGIAPVRAAQAHGGPRDLTSFDFALYPPSAWWSTTWAMPWQSRMRAFIKATRLLGGELPSESSKWGIATACMAGDWKPIAGQWNDSPDAGHLWSLLKEFKAVWKTEREAAVPKVHMYTCVSLSLYIYI